MQREDNATPQAGPGSSLSPCSGLDLRALRFHSREQVATPWHPAQAEQLQSFPVSHTSLGSILALYQPSLKPRELPRTTQAGVCVG